MIQLSREIRFALSAPEQSSTGRPGNSWAGWPSTNRVVPHLILRMVIEGVPDPVTGYLCNIKIIDDLLRSIVIDCLIPASNDSNRPLTAEAMVQIVYREAVTRWEATPRIVSVRLELTPFLSYSIVASSARRQPDQEKLTMSQPQAQVVQLTQQFEFSAAHRLHCESLSDEENRQVFGKCNNPEGHGHNYVLEVTVSREIDGAQSQVINLQEFEAIVKRIVIDPLDHKHLNRDLEYFANINPSVENIAIMIFDALDGQFETSQLVSVKVFETPKTWAEYSGKLLV